jgi:hypothetical protein
MARRRMERIAHNESVFRALNESLEASLHRGRPDGDRAGFVCECGDPNCDETVRVELPAYESVRADSQLFVVLPGHNACDVEDVVSDGDGYVVVRKHAEAAKIVERTDPRRATR